MGREVGGGIGMGKTCEPKAFSFQCMTKFTTKKKKKKKKCLGLCERSSFTQIHWDWVLELKITPIRKIKDKILSIKHLMLSGFLIFTHKICMK